MRGRFYVVPFQISLVIVQHRSRSGNLGVVLDSASRREAKRGQSTNQKGEMSRASRNKQKIVKKSKRIWTNTVTIWTNNLSGPSDGVSKRLLGFEEGMYEEKYVIVCNH